MLAVSRARPVAEESSQCRWAFWLLLCTISPSAAPQQSRSTTVCAHVPLVVFYTSQNLPCSRGNSLNGYLAHTLKSILSSERHGIICQEFLWFSPTCFSFFRSFHTSLRGCLVSSQGCEVFLFKMRLWCKECSDWQSGIEAAAVCKTKVLILAIFFIIII